MSDDFVYHYTTQDGFLGIVDSRSLWATGISYLNDSMEFEYAKQLLKSFSSAMLEKVEDEYNEEFFNRINKWSDGLCCDWCYVVSFSENKDLLSQWRAYSKNDVGFSLGFSKKNIKNLCKEYDYNFGKCIYDSDKQLSIIGNIIKNIPPRNDRSKDEFADKSYHIFLNEFFSIAPLFKHESFAEESEYRIFSRINLLNYGHKIDNLPDVDKSKKPFFRKGKSMLIPYTKFPIEINGNLIIDKVCLGPTPHIRLSYESVFFMLDGITTDCEISFSTIPFRNW